MTILTKKNLVLVIVLNVILSISSFAEEVLTNSVETSAVNTQPATPSSEELVQLSWEASAQRNIEQLDQLVGQCLEIYGQSARSQQAGLTSFPERGTEKNYQALNDVGTCLFIKAEFTMNSGMTQEAIKQFQDIIKEYSWAQAWDPSRGAFWSILEKSQASIDVLTGKAEDDVEKMREVSVRTKPKIFTPGKQQVIDYTKFGQFYNIGTDQYHYSIKKMDALKAATGEGIYPNITDIYKNPRFKELKKEGKIEQGGYWDFVNVNDLELAYFKWLKANEPGGVKLFYVALILEKSEMYYEAIKAYQAIVIHFPRTVAWTYWKTPWYPAQAAIAKIRHIIRAHPELNLEEIGMKIEVKNGFDNSVDNDVFIVDPGKIIKRASKKKNVIEKSLELTKIKQTLGEGKVHLVQYENNHWQLMVDGKPYVIKGMTYAPTKIGQSPDKGTLENWMIEDVNKNGKIDGPYEAWVDKNRNNQQDEDESTVGDFQLLKEMGVNTLRIYHVPTTPNKELLRDLYNNYGIRVIMGDFLGKYTIGSGASWKEGTDYENSEHQKNMLESVKKMVMEHKDEPYILFWLLGNENNYGVASNADKKPEAFFKFTDEVAQWIKSVDKDHPVAVSNGDTLYLDVFAKNAPNIDIFASNVYRGDYGFGSFWEQVAGATGKPAIIAEYGCPAYAGYLTLEEAEEEQAKYHLGNWIDIQENMAGNPRGQGNSLGGIAFEWMDEWWKNYEPFRHDRKSDAIGPFPGGYYFEEWFGLVGQGNGRESPFIRQLRKSYFTYQDLWSKI